MGGGCVVVVDDARHQDCVSPLSSLIRYFNLENSFENL